MDQKDNEKWINDNKHLFHNRSKGIYSVNKTKEKVLFLDYDTLLKSPIYEKIIKGSPLSKRIIESSEDDDIVCVIMFGDNEPPKLLAIPLT